MFLFGQIHSSLIGDQLYSDTPPPLLRVFSDVGFILLQNNEIHYGLLLSEYNTNVVTKEIAY